MLAGSPEQVDSPWRVTSAGVTAHPHPTPQELWPAVLAADQQSRLQGPARPGKTCTQAECQLAAGIGAKQFVMKNPPEVCASGCDFRHSPTIAQETD